MSIPISSRAAKDAAIVATYTPTMCLVPVPLISSDHSGQSSRRECDVADIGHVPAARDLKRAQRELAARTWQREDTQPDRPEILDVRLGAGARSSLTFSGD